MVAMTSTEGAVPSPSGHELGSSSASGALLPPLPEALPVPMDPVPEDVPLRPVLSAWSPVAALRDLLKVLNGPTYGTKDELWKRLCEYEARAEQQLRERQWIEARKKELIQGSRPHEPEILDAPSKPDDPLEIERHEVTHIPPMPWCLACRLGKGRDASHFQSPAVREAAQIQIDFCFLRDDAAAYEVAEPVPENLWATILCAVDVATQNPLAIALPGKNAELEYVTGQLVSFIKRLGYTELVVRSDGEPSITAIVDRLMAEIKKTGVQARVRSEKTPRYSSQSLGAVGSMQSLLQKQVRTLKTDLETKIKSHLLTSMAVWPWLVRHSAWLVERYQMRANGRTSYQDCFGTIYTGIVLRFGEQAIFRHLVGTARGRNRQNFKQLRKEKAANKMDLGIWLGKTYESDEHYMGTSDGKITARTCRRMPSDGQWNLEAVKVVTGVPWNMEAGRLIGRPRHARIQVLPSLPEAPSRSSQPVSPESATIPPVPPSVPPPAPPPPSAPPEPVPTASMTVDDEQSRVQEWRRHAKRQAEVSLEDLDPAMIFSDETPGGLGRAVGALEVIEELEPSDPEEDDECDFVAGGDVEREEGRHRGRLEELEKMQEFKLYDVVPRQEALEKGWRVLKFRWVDKERPEVWRCRYVVKDFRTLQPWRRDLFHSEQFADHESDCGCGGRKPRLG